MTLTERAYAYGVYWPSQNDIPDLLSLSYIGEEDGHRQYRCLSTDAAVLDQLPKEQLNSGDSCLFVDTFEYNEYLDTTEEWYKA